jgi:serine/threonine protein kinase
LRYPPTVIAELVGHYRVVASLGSGGMGVVWKAIDTRLNRPVALKAIRDTATGNTDAVLRLRAEALAAASLDHPYICKIYELLETGTATMVVMEFVEGETLGDILSRRVPALGDTLRYGSEIAEGLANAHARGIVHRDVKPSNVMVTPHNHIKLLDFGIARIAVTGDTETQIGGGLTLPGDAPGTPQYMAPEQALGRSLDGRTDLFSLGVVLFRCLTGQLPFEGNTRDEYVQQMLSGKMRSLDDLAPETPYQVREIVKACLQREPDKRPESAAVVADTLRRAADALSTGSLPIASAPPRGLQRWGVQMALLAFAIVAGVFALLQWTIRPVDEGPRELRPAVTWPSAESGARISPDGKWLSFISDKGNESRLYVQAMDKGNPLPVDVQGTVLSHAWSPDGRELACILRQGDNQFLVVVPAFFGGSPRASVPIEKHAQQASISRWVGDSVYLEYDRGETGLALARVTLPSGEMEDIFAKWPKTVAFRNLRSAEVSPNGEQVVLDAYADGGSDLWLAKLDGSGLRRLTDNASVDRHPVWVGNDSIAYQSNRGGQLDLWRISTSTQRTTQITASHLEEIPCDGTHDGATIAFEQLTHTNSLWRLDLASGGQRQLTGDTLGDYWPSVSETGGRLVFQRTQPTPQEGFQFLDAQVRAAPFGTSTADAQTIADGFGPRLSPDGQWVAFYQRLPGIRSLRVLVKNLVNGESRTLSDRGLMPAITATSMPVDWIGQTMAWSPMGTQLFFLAVSGGGHDIQRADLQSTSDPVVVAKAEPGTTFKDLYVSPDGGSLAWIAVSKDHVTVEVLTLPSTRRSLPAVAREAGVSHYLAGWTSEKAVLFERTRQRGVGYEMQLTEMPLSGEPRAIASVADLPVPAVRVDVSRARALVTRNEEGVHNIYAVSFRDGTLVRITNNESPGVSFSGIEPLRADALVFAREERKSDIWVVQRKTDK